LQAILLLINLTKTTNANIQKIIAFESGFDRIMDIIDGETAEASLGEGGIIVEDCLNLLIQLLKANNSNQSFFIEANYIKKICKYFDLSSKTPDSEQATSSTEKKSWSMQKTINTSLLLKLIRCLVAPNNTNSKQEQIVACQKAYNHFGLLHRLCAMLIVQEGMPVDLLCQTLATIGQVIKGLLDFF
jgi:intracellular protein transport protein USO1